MPGNSYSQNGSGPFVFLTSEDVRYAWELAQDSQREWGNGNPGVLGHAVGSQAMGFMGEIAACRFYGIEFRGSTHGADDGYDIKLDGWTANVKATQYFDDPWLRVMDWQNSGCDVYILCAVNVTSGIVKMVGWMPVSQFKRKPLKKLRPDLPPCRVATVQDLHPCIRPENGH